MLKKNKIIHLDGLSTTNFINKNYKNILDWWNSEEVVIIKDKLKKYLFVEKKDYYKKIITDLHKVKILHHN